MKILFLGANGQLGQTFRHKLKTQEREAAFAGRDVIDLTCNQNILRGLDATCPRVVFNCAAYTAVDRAEDEPELANQINGSAVGTIAKWCAQNDAIMFHYSTDYVFDGETFDAYSETSTPNPRSAYGKSKLAGETAFKKANCRGYCLRTSWVHSKFGTNFYLTMQKLFSEREEVRIINDQFGVPTTTEFIVKQSLYLLDSGIAKNARADVLHLAPHGSTSWYGFGSYIHKKTKLLKGNIKCQSVIPILSSDYPQKAKRPKNSILSNKKLIGMIGQDTPSWNSIHDQLYGNV